MNNLADYKFRGFAGKSDYPKMAELLQAISVADNAGFWTTAEDIERDYQHLVNSKPETDMLMVERANGTLTAYARTGWEVDDESRQVFGFPFNIHPEERTVELNRHMLQWVAGHVAEVAAQAEVAGPKILRAILRNVETESALEAALQAEGYQPVRFMNRMRRDLSEPIETPNLPEGLEIRPVTDFRKLVQALDEAFRDHWGHAPITEENYQAFTTSPNFQPALWQVAWDGDEIAAGVLNFVDEPSNKKFEVQRGWTDPIFTRRSWRKRGLARALLLRSLEMFREMGMTEAMLGVDTQNPNGAFRLYESCGFKPVMRSIIYEKPVNLV
jgi:GNAT superfamily N-acetyltransferase